MIQQYPPPSLHLRRSAASDPWVEFHEGVGDVFADAGAVVDRYGADVHYFDLYNVHYADGG